MAGPFLNVNPVELVLQSYDQRINITLFDENGDPVDATYLHLKVMDVSKVVLYEDDFITPPAPPTRIIKPAGTTGGYYIDWGDPSIPNQRETTTIRDLFFVWRAIGGAGTEPAVALQVVKVVDPLVLSYLPQFRLQVDKAAKIVDEAGNIFLGYSDAQLLLFLESGLNLINTYQPNTSMVLESFPRTHLHLLIDVATIVALQAQEVFAIDTDINYSDQGYAFNISHTQPIHSFLQMLLSRTDRLVPLFKLNFATMGSLAIQAGPSFRMLQLMQAAPRGILFRGYLST